MIKLLLFFILFALCWPLALVALLFIPVLWLIALPFRLLGFVLTAVFHLAFSLAWLAAGFWLLWMIASLPLRLLGLGPFRDPRLVV